jgi:signal transduction histidine kinase
VIGDQVVQVKIWRADGTVVYSDDDGPHRRQFELSQDELDVFAPGSEPVAEISELDEDENAAQRDAVGSCRSTSASAPPATTAAVRGLPLLRHDREASRERTLSFLPVLVGGLALLWLAQAPLAWRMASRLRAVHDEREQLLVAALAASDRERSRIAADLHDGVVQGLSGASYTLTAEAARVSVAGHRDTGDVLHGLAVDLRRSVRELRSLIVTITPPGSGASRCSPASRTSSRRSRTAGSRSGSPRLPTSRWTTRSSTSSCAPRRKGVRNMLRHAGARSATVELLADEERVVLTVTDDGAGFRPGPGAGRRDSMGLDLLASLAQQLGGRIEVRSAPGAGTQLELEVPGHARQPVPA